MGAPSLIQGLIRPAFRLDRTQVKPLVGVECATAIGISLAVGLATGRATDGAWGAIGAFLTNFSVFQPGYRIRARVVVSASVVVAVGVFLGAVCGIDHLVVFPVIAGWTFLAGMLVAVGPNAGVVGVVSSVGLVVASSLDAAPSLALEDTAMALGGGLLVALLVPAFHRRGVRAENAALEAAYRVLADYASAIVRGESSLPDAGAFDTVAATLAVPGPHRTRHLGARDRALARQAEQLRTALAALAEARSRLAEDPGHDPTGRAAAAIDMFAAATEGVLRDVARACAHDRAPGPLGELGRHLLAADRALHPPAPDSTGAGTGDGTPTVARPAGGGKHHVLTRVAALFKEIRSHLRQVRHLLGGRTDDDGSTPPPVGWRAGPRPDALAEAWLAIRANLTTRSTACRHALRLAVVVTVATVLYRVIDTRDGYWIVVAVLFIMKPDFGSTVGRGLLRITGTVAGVTLATLLIASLRPGPVVLAVLTVATSALAYTFFTANYGAFTIFLTCLTVFLAAFNGLPPMTAVANRAVDNLIGSGLTILAAVVWPTWVATAVPTLVAACLRAEHRFGDAVLSTFVAPAPGPADTISEESIDKLVGEARLARSNAEAAVQRMGAETPGVRKGTLDLTTAEGTLAQMHRYGLAGLSLRPMRPPAGGRGMTGLAPLQEQITASFAALADAVEAGTPCPPPALRAATPGGAVVASGGPVDGGASAAAGHADQDDRLRRIDEVVAEEAEVMANAVGTAIDLYNEYHATPVPSPRP